MVVDSAFENSGKKKGLEIWRIENFQVVPYDPAKYGVFYSGDSYIILKTKEVQNHLEWDIHFWLGEETSQDEAGTAAYKAVELDDSLGGLPVQYREEEGHESKLFLSYFKNGVRYLSGGVKSGFRHVDPNAVEKRLMQVKGKRRIRAKQVPLSVNSMNKGDCFILDAGPEIYLWIGDDSGRLERIKANNLALEIRDQDHGGRSEVIRIDETSSASEQQKFFEVLGEGNQDAVKSADKGGDDVEHERQESVTVSLYKVSDTSGQLKTEKVADKPLKQEHLNSGDCFILDGGPSGIFVWIGKTSSKDEKLQSMKMATDYIQKNNYPKWTAVTRVVDGGEPPLFKQYFSVWKEPEDQRGLGRITTKGQVAVEEKFNVHKLHTKARRLLAKSLGKAYGFCPDDGTGKLEIWRIENFELAPIDPSIYGMFFGGDSYVIKYCYMKDNREHYIVYYWQGLKSTQDERAASAIWAVKVDNDVGGRAIQIRVVQDAEPYHFLKIFRGKMVIFMGGHASGFRNIHDYDTYDVDGTRLFQVRGTCADDVRAVQVPEVAGSLSSDDVFVLETPKATYVWIGKGASDEEKEMGTNVTNLVSPGRDTKVINEGDEPNEFWSGLGGKGDYKKGFEEPEVPLLPPRLFQCSDASGKFRVEEIVGFSKDDLDGDDVMVLDSGEEVYVWLGNGSTEDEKKNAIKLAEDYIRTDPTDRNLDNTVIIRIKQGDEPPSFKALFDSWE